MFLVSRGQCEVREVITKSYWDSTCCHSGAGEKGANLAPRGRDGLSVFTSVSAAESLLTLKEAVLLPPLLLCDLQLAQGVRESFFINSLLL